MMSDNLPKETWNDFVQVAIDSRWKDLRLSHKLTRVFFIFPIMVLFAVITFPLFLLENLLEKFGTSGMTKEEKKKWWKNKEEGFKSLLSALHSAFPFFWLIAGVLVAFEGNYEYMMLCFIMSEVVSMNIKMDKIDTIIHEKE
jgi:hypothetical protein